jgi:site-specific recombinase XerD
MRTIGDRAEGHRLRALMVLLWRAGLRISEALALQESDLDRSRGAVLVRRGLCRIRHSPCYAGAMVMPSLR